MNIALMDESHVEQAIALWRRTPGVGLRSLDDSLDGIGKLLRRNPTTCFAAVLDHQVVGTVLCAHDGRRGHMYHLCVAANQRRQGLGRALVRAALGALDAEGIRKVSLVVYSDNSSGLAFWQSLGWQLRSDLTYLDFAIEAQD